jgi:hypothetical protein
MHEQAGLDIGPSWTRQKLYEWMERVGVEDWSKERQSKEANG